MAKFRKINLEICRNKGYGQYTIKAAYKGKDIEVHSTDSETYDWLNDNSNKSKHSQAKRACYCAIVARYNHLFK